MTTQTTAITLSSSAYVTNAASITVITSGPAVINPTYTAGVVQSFTNFGTLDSTGTAANAQSSGILLTLGDAAGLSSTINNSGGLVTGYDYGIFLAANNATSVPGIILNSGTILGRASSAHINADQLQAAAILGGANTVLTINNTGLIEGGEGIWLLSNDAGTQVVNNGVGGRIIGTTSENGHIYGIKIQDNNNGLQGTGTVINAGYIGGYVDVAALHANVTNLSTGTINGQIFALGSGTLDLVAGGKVADGAAFLDGAANGLSLGLSTIILNGSAATVGQLTDAAQYTGFGFVTIAAGSTWLLGTSSSSAGFASVSQIADFGTIDLAGALSGNTINMEGSVAGTSTEVDFTGTNSATPLIDYGANDKIVFSTLTGGAGTSYLDSYNTATGVLTITEINAAGQSIGSASATVSGIPGGTALGPNSFVDINGPNGETVVLGSSTLANGGSIYLDYGDTATLTNTAGVDTMPVTFGSHQGSLGAENTLDINGTVAGTNSPYQGTITGFGLNDNIVLGTNLLAAGGAGTSYRDSYNTANGVLTVSELNAAGSVVGSTSLTIANTGGTLNSGSFVDVAGPNGVDIALASTQLTNSGSIFIDRGQQVTLSNTSGVDTVPVTFGANGTSLALNVLDLAGTVSGTTSPYQGAISGFGLNDDIILGPSVLPSVASGDTVTLSYTGSLLTVTELNVNGVSIGSTTLNVGTGYAAGSFVALLGANGVNIETPQTVDEQNFVFGPLTGGTNYQGNFENAADYQGGLAPGATIIAGETVTVAQPAQANVTSPLTNNGLIVLDAYNANMDATAAISGTGTIEVGGGSDLTLANTTGSTTDTIAFAGSGLLDLAGTGTASFTGTITGEDGTDTIEIGASVLPSPSGASAVSLSFNSATGVLSVFDTVGGTIYTEMLHFAGPVSNHFSASLSGGNIVISDVPCFAAGTRILTADGQKPVEQLRAGDSVLTVRDGAERRIIWTGQRTVDLAAHANPDKVRPVVIAAGAFGEGLPERDLKLSPDHALYIEGYLIEAKTLVNGATVTRDTSARYVTYHHIELARHDVVLAEGLAAETYLDSGNRRNFDSDAGPIMLHPDFAAASRAGACARLLTDGRVVRRVRQHLLDRALALGFMRTSRLDLTAKAGAELIEPMADSASEALLFILPHAVSSVVLRCATGVPAEVSADPSDRRELGVAIAELALVVNGQRIRIDLNDPAHTGLHAAEPGQRWTGSAARIVLPPYRGRAILELTIRGQAQRWRRTTGDRSVLAR
jgi:hypothetical protein